jgi:hypothetical protein
MKIFWQQYTITGNTITLTDIEENTSLESVQGIDSVDRVLHSGEVDIEKGLLLLFNVTKGQYYYSIEDASSLGNISINDNSTIEVDNSFSLDPTDKLLVVVECQRTLPFDAARNATLISIYRKLTSDAATNAKLQSVIDALAAISVTVEPPVGASTEATLQLVLAKLAAAPATENTLLAMAGKDFATQATLVAIDSLLASIMSSDGIKKIADALPPGNNLLGKLKLVDDAGNVINTFGAATPVSRTPVLSVISSNQVITAGKHFISIQTDSSFVGTVLGTSLPADYHLQFPVQGNDTLEAVAITISAGTCLVLTIG